MRFPNLQLKYKITLISLLLAVSGLSLFFLLLLPQIFAVRNLAIDYAARQQEIKRLAVTHAGPKTLNQEMTKMREQITELNQALVRRGDEITFIQFLENLAVQHNVSQRIGLETPVPGSAELKVSLTISGTLDNFLSYLSALEHGGYYFNIISYKVETAASAQTRGYFDQNVAPSTAIGGVGRLVGDSGSEVATPLPVVQNLYINLQGKVYLYD